MAVIGTFGSFTAARLGIYASQSSLNVTGNNIANINTTGYTRQRADLVSLYSYGTARYANSRDLNIGYGVLIDTVSQLRDPFLDIRYREENAKMGAYESKLDCLTQLGNILDEVGRGNDDFGIIAAQLADFLGQLQELNGKVGSVENDTVARGSAQTLARLFNSYSNAMDTLSANKLAELKENVKTVNALLTQIRDLSAQIRDADIIHDPALELRDTRNLCIDKLSAYMKINVSYDMEKIDEWNSVERMTISIADSGTPPIKLIQGIYGAQISMPEEAAKRNPLYNPALGRSYQYISRDSDFAKGDIKYTNNIREALKIKNQAVTNDAAGNTLLTDNGYGTGDVLDPNEYMKPEYAPYLKAGKGKDDNGNDIDIEVGTWDEKEAILVDNAVEGSKENRLWMTVEPLVDAKGKYMRDETHQQIKESVDLPDTLLYGSLQSIREFLTEKGEFSSEDDLKFDSEAAQKRGIQYYQNALDALARKFAESFNNANRLNIEDVLAAYQNENGDFLDSNRKQLVLETKDSNGASVNPQFFKDLTTNMAKLETLKELVASGAFKDDATAPDPDDPDKDITLDDALDRIATLEKLVSNDTKIAYEAMEELRQKGQLTDLWSFYNGGVLFSNNGDNNDPTGITAGNISISKGWSSGAVRLLHTKLADGLDHSTSNDNIMHMIAMMSEDMDYFPNEIVGNAMNKGGDRYFTGSFAERLADMNSILSVETNTTTLLYNEYTGTTLSLENSRQSVAGVDLNDEATNMMVFQKAYSAACQLMTTLDSMLDKLINGTLR